MFQNNCVTNTWLGIVSREFSNDFSATLKHENITDSSCILNYSTIKAFPSAQRALTIRLSYSGMFLLSNFNLRYRDVKVFLFKDVLLLLELYFLWDIKSSSDISCIDLSKCHIAYATRRKDHIRTRFWMAPSAVFQITGYPKNCTLSLRRGNPLSIEFKQKTYAPRLIAILIRNYTIHKQYKNFILILLIILFLIKITKLPSNIICNKII